MGTLARVASAVRRGAEAALLLLGVGALPAQTPGGAAAAASYEATYAGVIALQPNRERVTPVSGVELERDAGRFSLKTGTLALLSAVGGRVVGAAFEGDATFDFTPPTQIERDRLARFENTSSLSLPVSRVVLLFGDSTLAELERQLTFAPGAVSHELDREVLTARRHLGDEGRRSFDPDLMAAFLNRESTGVFFAHIVPANGGGALEFMVNPAEVEGVTLAKWFQRGVWTREAEVICRFAPRTASRVPPAYERRTAALIGDYRLDVTLAQTFTGELSFAAAARIAITAQAPAGPWIPFELFPKLEIDSVRWDDGRAVLFAKGHDDDVVWLRLDQRLAAGEARSVTLYYRGDMIDRFGNYYFINSSIAWYPRSLEGRSYATFDITYHTPRHLLLASVGEQRSDTIVDRMRTSRWTTDRAIRNASFNLGQFEEVQIAEPGLPPVTVLVSERVPGFLEKKQMKHAVGTDVTQSLKFFQHLFGPPPGAHLFATEIPYGHGEAFPGLINLSWYTFRFRDPHGEDQVFRAHEVAHQWWGLGVDFATYHDQWLSEGIANFAGLWYLHAARHDSEKYFAVLRDWRVDVLRRRDEPSPIWLGYRTASMKDERGYAVLVYQKGAWVMHMLRILMLDLKTGKDDAFAAMLRDFYETYRGHRASTGDFQRIVEQHVGVNMDWFFNEWVYGSAIPTYRVATKTEPADGGRYRVTLRVDQEGVADDFRMYVPVTVDLDRNRQARFRVEVRGPHTEIALPLVPSEPRRVNFNELEGVLCEVKNVPW